MPAACPVEEVLPNVTLKGDAPIMSRSAMATGPVDERLDVGHARHQYSREVPQHWAEIDGRWRTLADR